MTGVYWWDPWHTIYGSIMDPMGIFFIQISDILWFTQMYVDLTQLIRGLCMIMSHEPRLKTLRLSQNQLRLLPRSFGSGHPGDVAALGVAFHVEVVVYSRVHTPG